MRVVEDTVILGHALVPKHEILTKKGSKELLEKYKASKDALPKIIAADPIIKAIGAKKGDIIKITRESMTAGEAMYYRVVI